MSFFERTLIQFRNSSSVNAIGEYLNSRDNRTRIVLFALAVIVAMGMIFRCFCCTGSSLNRSRVRNTGSFSVGSISNRTSSALGADRTNNNSLAARSNIPISPKRYRLNAFARSVRVDEMEKVCAQHGQPYDYSSHNGIDPVLTAEQIYLRYGRPRLPATTSSFSSKAKPILDLDLSSAKTTETPASSSSSTAEPPYDGSIPPVIVSIGKDMNVPALQKDSVTPEQQKKRATSASNSILYYQAISRPNYGDHSNSSVSSVPIVSSGP